MDVRNMEGAARSADINRTAAAATSGRNSPQSVAATASSTPSSRGAFFDMMVAAQPAAPTPPAPNRPAIPAATARARPQGAAISLSVDEKPTGVRDTSRPGPKVEEVRNSPAPAPAPSSSLDPPDSVPTAPVSDNPVDVINALLTRLGYDASAFQTRVTSSQISYPGASYEYPLLEVNVNGERVGFHLPSAMRDPRITAANISAMLGRPLLNLGVFA